MKKITLLLFISMLFLSVLAQDSLNITRLSVWISDSASSYNDCWGYSANGREYAIVGSNWGTHFVDITDPTVPTEVGSFAGRVTGAVWRDFKVYGNYAYGVCDGPGNSSLQIFNLANLPSNIIKVYDEDSLSTRAHNIFIEDDRIYLPSNKRSGSGYALDILSLSNPTAPTLLATMDNSYFGGCSGCLHDIYVKNDTAYCSAGNAGLYIYDLTDPLTPALISSITGYSEQGYNHASWVNEEYGTMVMADETHGTGLKSFDISDITNPTETDVFRSNVGALPHNPFIRGTEAIVSYYHDGVQIFDISNPSNVTQKAFYDTYPDNPGNYSGYQGDWGVYPFFESNNIIASDISYGLFVLGKVNDVFTTETEIEVCPGGIMIVPFNIRGTFDANNKYYLEMSDINGHFVNGQHLDSISGTSAGVLTTPLPGIVSAGQSYRVRVVSSSPSIIDGGYTNLRVSDYLYNTTSISICEGDTAFIGENVYTIEGNYTDTIQGVNCDTIVGITIDVDTVDAPTITQNGLILSSSTMPNYQWYFDGNPISWGTNQTINLATLGYGYYQVETMSGACVVRSDSFHYTIVDGLPHLNDELVAIFPNPSNGKMTISNFSKTNLTASILNVDGSLCNSYVLQRSLEISLPKGIYYIQLQNNSSIQIEKIVVH